MHLEQAQQHRCVPDGAMSSCVTLLSCGSEASRWREICRLLGLVGANNTPDSGAGGGRHVMQFTVLVLFTLLLRLVVVGHACIPLITAFCAQILF